MPCFLVIDAPVAEAGRVQERKTNLQGIAIVRVCLPGRLAEPAATKADELSRRRSGSLHITQLDLSDIKVRIYGDTAVVTSKADLVGKNGDRDISWRFRYTRVYSNRDGQWRIVSFEASRISGGNVG